MNTERGRFRLPRTARITASDEIRALFRRGKRKRTRHLDVFVASSPVVHSRLGLVVPKPRAGTRRGQRVKSAAVRRNQLKRRLREIGRTLVLPALDGAERHLDVLVRARPEAYEASFAALREELARLTEELCSSGR